MANDAYLPSTATRVKVTNVIDPFHMRIYEIETYACQMNQLEGKLQQLAKTELPKYRDDWAPSIGDLVLVNSQNRFNVDLPAWCCRGIIGYGKTMDSKYRVFFPDHGIALNCWLEDLRILPPVSISNEYLTTTVGLYDILPVIVDNSISRVSEQWSPSAIKFTREIISAATQLYFDHLTSDKSGNKFGELYLILDGDILTLSKALARNRYATIINDELMEIIQNPDTPALQSSAEIVQEMPNGHTGNRERESSDKPDRDQRRAQNDAVHPRAFDGLSKTNLAADPDCEIRVYSRVQCERLNLVTEARFPVRIHKSLQQLSFVRPMRLQGYVWPAITKGLNVVAVAARQSGKTISYLVPVVSAIAANETYPKVSRVNGPLALILCVSALDVYHVTERCKELLQNYERVKILSAYNGISEQSIVAHAYNGCEILISTPSYLSRLIKKDKKLLNFSRLSHMVFDEADVILEMYPDSLREILNIQNEVHNSSRNSPRELPLQIIAVARHWTPYLKKFVNSFIEEPYVCIGSYMEAAVYAGFKPRLIFLPKNQKATKVLELLGNRWAMTKTIIVCTTTEEATELAEVLKSNSIDTLIVHDTTIITEIKGVTETWMTTVSGRYFVLVSTDQVLSDLNIKDAEWLIHYSLSTNTKSQFYYRFSTLTNGYSRGGRRKDKLKPSFTMMADESNDAQLNGVVNVMRRLDAKIPPLMEEYLEKIFKSAEMAKTNRRLCDYVKAFGSCPVRDFCTSRHMFVPEVDQPTTAIRIGDWVKLVITGRHGHSANHFSARVVEYTKASTKERVLFSFQEFADLSVKMQKHYANPANRRSSKLTNIGQVCAFEEAPGNYKRLQVLSTIDKDKNTIDIQSVDVRCIDDGELFSVKVSHLLEIPEDLARWPSHIVDIYLSGIIPFDNEPTWSPCTEEIVRKWFEENLAHPTSHLYAKVLLHLGHILWVDPLEVRHKLPDGYPDLVDSSLKAALIKAKCAAENKEHIVKLLDLCRSSEIDINPLTSTSAP